MLKALGSKIRLDEENPYAEEYLSYVSDIMDHDIVCRMKDYMQHGRTTTYQHCLNVSWYNFVLCKLLSLDARAGARGGFLHDLFLYDWHIHTPRKGRLMHPFTHPEDALENAKQHFELTVKEEDIIAKHMFPIATSFPKYRETVIITIVDKYCGFIEAVDGWAANAKDAFINMRTVLKRKSV